MVRPVDVRLGFLTAFLAAASLAASSSPALAAYSYLTAQQLTQLRALPLPIVLPASVPSGYRLVHFAAVRDEVRNGLHSAPANSYELDFRNGAGRTVKIFAADSGFGDADPDTSSYRRPFTAKSSVLGSTQFEPYNINGTWSWAATYIPLDRTKKPLMNIQGTDSAALATFYESMQRLPK